MRTLPAILLAALTALVILASAVLTTQFGMRDWPTPPLPDTATRLVTPAEAAGRATSKLSEGDASGGAAGPRIAATTAPAAERPRVRRSVAPGPAPARARRGSSPERRPAGPRAPTAPRPDEGAPPQTDQGTAPAPAPAPAAPAPVGDGDAPVIGDGSGDDSQARPHDDAAPDGSAPPVPAEDDDTPGDSRGPVRHVLQDVLSTP